MNKFCSSLVSGFYKKEENLNLVPYHKIDSKKTCMSYKLKWEGVSKNAWVLFTNKKVVSLARKSKYHISIKRDPNNLTKAYDIIFPILEKYQISSFKIIPLASIALKGNSLGKEFTIYIEDTNGSNEANPDFWSQRVLKEIVENLEIEGVIAGNVSKGDISIKGGKNFIYSRSASNIFNNYVCASFLEKTEFAAEESARLSPSLWVDLIIEGYEAEKINSNKATLNLPEILPELKFETDQIYSHFVNVLQTKVERKELGTAPALFFLLSGSDLRGRGEIPEPIFEFLFHKVDQEFDLKINFLEPYLKKAAYLTALIQSLHGSPLEQIGNIHPAIYHSFIIPLVTKMNEKFDFILEDHEEIKLMSHIVTCAIRNQYFEFKDPDTIIDFCKTTTASMHSPKFKTTYRPSQNFSTVKGSESKGQVKGSEVKGSEVKGSEVKGSEVKGSESKSQVKGSEVKGSGLQFCNNSVLQF